MNKETRDQIVEHDLGWARDIKAREVDGRMLMAPEDAKKIPYNVAHIMKEEEFLREWIMQFAVGNRIGGNYFNQASWFGFSYGGTRNVMVVRQDQETGGWKPVLIVPPLTTINLTKEDREKLRLAASVMEANSKDASKKHDINANLHVANTLASPTIGLEAKAMTLTDLIRPDYFKEHGIVPEAEQCVYWLKDQIRGISKARGGLDSLPAELDRARDIFYHYYLEEQILNTEIQWLREYSLGQFPEWPGVDVITDGSKDRRISVTDGKNAPVNPETGVAEVTQEDKSKGYQRPDSPLEC